MDEKQKLLILGGLAVVMIGVGVFSFRNSLSATQAEQNVVAEPAEQTVATTEETAGAVKNPMFAMNLAPRDPFAVPIGQMSFNVESAPPPQSPTYVPPPVNGRLEPVTGVTVGGVGSLPQTSVNVNGEGGITVPEPQFSYTVSGVIIGRKPAVVFRDPQGNQKLVAEGAKLDEDSKVQAVRLGHVTVLYRGKSLRLPVGGESIAQ